MIWVSQTFGEFNLQKHPKITKLIHISCNFTLAKTKIVEFLELHMVKIYTNLHTATTTHH